MLESRGLWWSVGWWVEVGVGEGDGGDEAGVTVDIVTHGHQATIRQPNVILALDTTRVI